jgi:hypothetical protein
MLAILWLMAIRITVMQRLIFTTKGNTSMSVPTMCLLFSIELHVQEGEDQRERVQCREYYCRDLTLVLDRFLLDGTMNVRKQARVSESRARD